jgi:hypothetical protein
MMPLACRDRPDVPRSIAPAALGGQRHGVALPDPRRGFAEDDIPQTWSDSLDACRRRSTQAETPDRALHCLTPRFGCTWFPCDGESNRYYAAQRPSISMSAR